MVIINKQIHHPMKKYLSIIGIMLFAIFGMTSCLEHGLDDLEAFDTADIENWPVAYYRYYTGDEMAVNGEQQVKQIQLTRTAGEYDFDEENKTGEPFFNITVAPNNVPEEEKANVDAKNLVVVLTISTAATVTPVDGAPKLGVPGDWSKPNKYKVTAANGNSRIWTVTVNLQK